jgi:hypothetical protein
MENYSMSHLFQPVLVTLMFSFAAAAQPVGGAPYGTRDPNTCASRKAPANGAPSVAQATAYFKCSMEYFFGDKLVLVENVTVEVGNGRRFLRSDSELKEVDPQYLIYPIRGSFDKYFCSRWPVWGGVPDKTQPNCLLSRPRNTVGVCYRTSFADWKCEMSSNAAISDTETVFGPR